MAIHSIIERNNCDNSGLNNKGVNLEELLKRLTLHIADKWEQPYSVTKGLSMLA